MKAGQKSNNIHSLWQELELLEKNPVLLDGKLIKPSGCYRLTGNPPKLIYNTNCPDELKKKVDEILLKFQASKSNVSYFYSIDFDFDNVHYSGRFTPEFEQYNDLPSSWHVVLNELFFGYVHKNSNRWENSENTSARLTAKIGNLIDSGAYRHETV
jgi:hypothetical protein